MLYFESFVDLRKSCIKNRVFSLSFPNANVIHNHITVIKTKKLTLASYYQYTKQLIRNLISFPIMSLFFWGILFSIPYYSWLLFLLGLLHCHNSSFFPCLSWPRQFVSTGQLFYWISLLFSHDWTGVMHFWQECHRNDDVSSVYHIMEFMVLVSYYLRFWRWSLG